MVVFVATDACRVHTVRMPGSVRNSFRAACPHHLPVAYVTNTQIDAHGSLLVSSKAAELNRTEVQVHANRQLRSSHMVCSSPC